LEIADSPALALVGLARIALRSHDVDGARHICHEALAVTEGTDDRSGCSGAMHVLGVAAEMATSDLDDLVTVRRHFRLDAPVLRRLEVA
jgi:hypothetical protein